MKILYNFKGKSGKRSIALACQSAIEIKEFIIKDNYNLIDFYCIYQNYPNPFNPSTRIQYAVNSTQKVTPGVCDLLGREIALFVHEEKEPGVYEIEFDGRKPSDGIYFYRLQAVPVGRQDFFETKKMAL